MVGTDELEKQIGLGRWMDGWMDLGDGYVDQ